MKLLIAYHNDPAIKAKYVERVRRHRKADQLIHGIGWANGKGCAVGCTLHGYNHQGYETELGIPALVARAEDVIFEGLRNGEAQEWPEAFLEAVAVGADLSLVWSRFAHWMLVDPERGVIRFADEKGAVAIRAVAALYQRKIDHDEPSGEEWSAAAAASAASAAARWSAAAAAADAAAAAAAACWSAAAAADAARWSAAAARWSAAAARWSAAAADAADAAADAADAARDTHWRSCRDKLLELLRSAPVPAGAT